MEQFFNADDQQASLCDLSWLGGIIDGEGSIQVAKGSKKRGKVQGVHPRITIVNTCPILIDKVKTILEEYHIAFYQNTTHYEYKLPAKPLHGVLIHGYKRATRFLELIIPYLVSKKLKACLLHDFCLMRAPHPRQPYSEDEKAVCRKIWELNGHGTTCWEHERASTTLRTAPEKGEDKV